MSLSIMDKDYNAINKLLNGGWIRYGDTSNYGVNSIASNNDWISGLSSEQRANYELGLRGLAAYDTYNQNIANQNDLIKQRNSLLSDKNTTDAWLGGTNAALQGVSTIGGLVMSIKNYQMQKDALKKQSQLIDEQISASRESRAQRKAELTRLNNVRSNTNKMFNNSAVVSRSY